ncbi:unnamed protein product [Caenorhabditis nigoni]
MEVTIESIQQAIHQLEGQLKRKLEAKDEMLAKKRKLYCAICKLSGHETTKCRHEMMKCSKATTAQRIQIAMDNNCCLNFNVPHRGEKPPACAKCNGMHVTAFHLH